MPLKIQYSNYGLECGTDEAGRGCLAGPVTAAAVILPLSFNNSSLNDSKQISEKNRNQLKSIIESEASHFSIEHIYETEIDEINILNASIKAMHQSISNLNIEPNYIMVLGTWRPCKNLVRLLILFFNFLLIYYSVLCQFC